MRYFISIIFLVCLAQFALIGQESDAVTNVQGKDIASLKHTWRARWITHPTANTQGYAVFLFRKDFELLTVPDSFFVYVSADNKFNLYVNGERISDGPVRSDLNHWGYETINIAPYLKEGKNTIGAHVVNFGIYRHAAQFTFQTAFILQGLSIDVFDIDTKPNNGWKVTQDFGYSYTPFVSDSVGGYYAAGPGDIFHADLHPWGWNQPIFESDSTWVDPIPAMVEFAVGRGFLYGSTWFLVPRTIPRMKTERQRLKKVVRSQGIQIVTEEISSKKLQLTIPRQTKASILLDNEVHTIGFPELYFSDGKGAKIKITYSEALFYKSSTSYSAHGGFKKGNRNLDWNDKEIRGYYDIVFPDGGKNRVYRPQAMRTYRFIQLDIETDDESLIIDDYYGMFTAYPFEQVNHFECDDENLMKIADIAWRTLQNSSTDGYIDPYYEQLQYIGDSRIESLASIYSTNDDRLMKNAIAQFDASRLDIGLTCSRYPSYIVQIIPTYSLLWISMVNDYYMYRNDPEFVKSMLPGILSILSYFTDKIDDTGMLSHLEWWNFTDWAVGFDNGIPPGADDGHSACVSLQYVYAIQKALPIIKKFGRASDYNYYENIATHMRESVMKHCYDHAKNMFAERPEKDIYSQHTNIFAILTYTAPDEKKLMQAILNDSALIQSTVYFKFYLARALQTVGMAEKYQSLLSPWHYMIKEGMTTFGETDKDPRSDCHGWSASPLFELYHTIAGIQPMEPGFQKVLIEPQLGHLNYIKVKFALPSGHKIFIDLHKDIQDKVHLKGAINIPPGVEVIYKEGAKELTLVSGVNIIK